MTGRRGALFVFLKGVNKYGIKIYLPRLWDPFGLSALNRFTLDGGVEIFPSELFDGAEKIDCYVSSEDYKSLTENPFVLGRAPVPLFYGCASEDVNTVGGFGNWVQDAEYTTCPHCGKPMKYLAQIQWDTVFDCAEGTLYIEFCPDCQIVSMQHQQT